MTSLYLLIVYNNVLLLQNSPYLYHFSAFNYELGVATMNDGVDKSKISLVALGHH